MLDLGELAVCEIAGERDPLAKLCLACVAPKHAGEPRGAFRPALSALIGGGVGVGVVGQIAGEPPDIGHGGEALRGDPLHTTVEGRAVGYRHHRRAHHAGIEKLAFGQPLGIGDATRGDRAVS